MLNDILACGIFIIGVLIGFSGGIHIGLYLDQIRQKAKDIYDRDPEPPAQVITPKRPGYADITELSAIVTPKTPDQIDREEQEQIRRMG
jgi:hypothetical protein